MPVLAPPQPQRTPSPSTPAPPVCFTPARSLLLRRKCACGGTAGASGECEECRKKRMLQRRAANAHFISSVPPIVHEVLSSPGRPLDAGTRRFMEPRFGHDFSQVRVHDDARAAESARAVDAHAYTVGQDIAFASGRYDPYSSSGRQLLAHELAHTVQQRGLQRSAAGVAIPSGVEDRCLEQEASHAAQTALAGESGPVRRLRSPDRAVISRVTANPTSWAAEPFHVRLDRYTNLGGRAEFDVTPLDLGPESGTGRRPISFSVRPFWLPINKRHNRARFIQAEAGGLQTDLVLPNLGATAQGSDNRDTLLDLWTQARGWPSSCRHLLWHRAGGDPHNTGGTAAPAAPVPANFGAANGNDADPDHIIDRQYGGTNLPDNIQLLDAGWNRQVGWYLGELNRALAREILDHYYPNRATRPSTIALRFDGIEVRGNPAQAAVPTDNPSRYTWAYCQANVCNGRARAVWEADLCARAMPASEVQTISHGAGVSSTPSPPATGTAQYTVRTPLATASFVTEARHTSSEKLDKPITGSAQDLIAGFILKTITLRSGTAIARGTKDRVVAELGTRPVSGRGASTAAPGVSEAAAENPPPTVQFTRDTEQLAATAPNEVGRLRLLRPGREVVRFHYPYLSNATLNLTQDSSGVVSGTGTLTPSIPLLNRAPLQLAFGPNLLRAFYGARPQNMRSPIPGFRFTEATLGVQLAPEFRPAGVIAFEVGPPRRPFLTGRVDASADQSGLVFTGTIDAHIPNTDVAHGRLAYRNHQWSGYIEVVSSQIHIPGVRRGQVRIDFNPDGSVVPSGEVFILAGASEARLGVAYRGGRFRFAGEGRFTLPGLEPIDARLESDGEHLTARAQTTVRIRGLRGTVSVNYRDGRWSGEGALPFSAGRANGNVTVRLNENGRVTGQGTLTYPITDRLTATIGVLLREDQSLHVNGEVRLADLELFQRFPRSGGRQRLSRVAPPDFPIYALPLGPFGSVGLAARVSLELGVNYGIGPGMLRNIRGTTAFDLFAENANFEFEAGAQLFIPFNAGFYLEVDGSVVLGLGPIAEVNGGIVVRGEAGLRGDFTAETRLQYRQAKFILDARAALQAHPELILSIAAFVRASALGLYETQRRWTLASFRFGSGRNFGLAFPFHYDSALGFTAPSFGAIEWIYPRDLSPRAMLGRLIS